MQMTMHEFAEFPVEIDVNAIILMILIEICSIFLKISVVIKRNIYVLFAKRHHSIQNACAKYKTTSKNARQSGFN